MIVYESVACYQKKQGRCVDQSVENRMADGDRKLCFGSVHESGKSSLWKTLNANYLLEPCSLPVVVTQSVYSLAKWIAERGVPCWRVRHMKDAWFIRMNKDWRNRSGYHQLNLHFLKNRELLKMLYATIILQKNMKSSTVIFSWPIFLYWVRNIFLWMWLVSSDQIRNRMFKISR